MERPARVAIEPGAHPFMFVGGVVVEDDVDQLACRNVAFKGIEKTDELLMPVALHVAPEHLPGHHVEGGEQRRRAVALVVMGHGRAAPLLQRQSRLRAIRSLDL